MLTKGVKETMQPSHDGPSTNGHTGDSRFWHLVAPNVAAVHHQHFFNFRLDLDVDEGPNSVREINTRALAPWPENPTLNDVLNLAIVIAERVTKRQGLLDPAVAVANVTEAMKIVVHASDLRIVIHPNQQTALDEALPRLKVQWPELQHVELVADETLEPGGCRLYTTHGQVDGDLNEQLRRIAADLLPGEEAA